MPSIYVYVSEETMRTLEEAAAERQSTVQELAENAVDEAALGWRNSRRSQRAEPELKFEGETE